MGRPTCASVSWSLAMDHEDTIRKAAADTAAAFGGVIPEEDLVQEGLLYVATHVDAFTAALQAGGDRQFEWDVRRKMRRWSTEEAGKRRSQTSFRDELGAP